MFDAMTAGYARIEGHGGDEIETYLARPTAEGKWGGVVVIHHLPGFDRTTKEITRTFATLGYNAILPNLYWREAPGASPDDAAAVARAQGGVPDERLVGDVEGAARYLRSLPDSNGKVGVIGHCSGGRHAFLAACSLPLDAAVDCYGAFVVARAPSSSPYQPPPLLGIAGRLTCPLLGLFGADDSYPTPAENRELEAELSRLGKTFEFHTYEGAGHAFFHTGRPSFRPEAAADGWRRIQDWFGRHLSG